MPLDGRTVDALDTAAAVVYGVESNEELGGNVRLARDIDGDGFADLVIVAYEGTFAPLGEVHVFYGPVEGVHLSSDADAQLEGDGDARALGEVKVADANGDGFSDLAIGAEQTDEYEYLGGAVFVVYGGERL